MDSTLLKEILSQSALLESLVSEIYLLFSKIFHEDREFWLQLYIDERIHASIFMMIRSDEVLFEQFPYSLIVTDIDTIVQMNTFLKEHLEQFSKKAPFRHDAIQFALQVEESVVELTYQKAMVSDSEHLLLLQRINRDSINHRDRVLKLLNDNSVSSGF